MDIRQSLFSLVNIGLAAIGAWFLFRKRPREAIASRGPLFIICFLLLLSSGISNLPLAVPALFERLLGHSVWMNYMPPLKLNVTQVGGTWWVVRWRDPIRTAYFYIFLGGLVWAIVNPVQGRAWKLNLFCVSFAGFMMLGSFVLSFLCFPFCFSW